MELAITKKHVLASQAKKEGGWYTKSKLETNEAAMIAKAWAWARSNNRIRVNKIHGEEEISILAHESWNMTSTDIEESTQTGSLEIQDDAGTLMNSNLPDFNDSDALAAHAHNRSAGTSSNGEGLGITNGVMSFKLSFPTISKTASPLQILPQFIEVLGRKVDKIQVEKDSS
ncbi:unnamed protein product [Durusdinium trenchii]|uniref:Uncharacterized protein n=1 Tax=Durusdinium trenchii TaxID=1381693 RepID=A0ABP0T1U7_9DINO